MNKCLLILTLFIESFRKISLSLLSIFVVILITPYFVNAQVKTLNQLAQKIILLDPSLGNTAITALLQTKDGYIWVGTEAGLARFDVARYEVFNTINTSAFLIDHISSLWEDNNGTLWIGTFGGGVVSYRNGQFTNAYSSKNGLLTDVIRTIYGDSDGTLWIATSNDGDRRGGLNRLRDGKLTSITTADGLPTSDIWTLYEDHLGGLWIGTYGGGVTRYFNGNFTTLTVSNGLAGNDIRAICEDNEGNIWIGTHDGGLSRYHDGVIKNFTTTDGLTSNLILTLLPRNGDLWIGTANGGLTRLRNDKFESLGPKDGLPSDTVASILFDREGNLWFGTTGALCVLQDGQFTTYTTREGLSFNLICPVTPSRKGGLWIGTFGGGLNRYYKGKFTNYTKDNGLPTNNINSLLEDRDGQLWIGTYGAGLSRFDGKNFINYSAKDGLMSNTIKALYQDREGTIWIGTDGGGLCRYRDGKFKSYTTADGLSHNIIIVIADDGAGGLWLGTDGGGLNHFSNNSFTTYTTKDGLINNRVWSLYRDADGSLWIGTDFGLSLFSNHKFINFTRRQGLIPESINQILDDQQGHLWVSSPRGVYRITRKSLADYIAGQIKTINVIGYGKADGLKNEQCTRWFQPAGCRTDDGRLWFPTIEGLSTIDPAATASSIPVKCIVEAILVDDNPIPDDQLLNIQASNNHFEFRYTSLSFTAPEKMFFRYQLEGFDANWINADSRRSAFYTNIPPGDYDFKVQVRNGEDNWSEIGRSKHFRILAPWWKTWPAYIIYVLTIMLVAGTIFSLRLGALQRWNANLQTAVNTRTAELGQKVAQIESSEKRFQAFMDNSPTIAYIKDSNGHYLYLNQKLEQLFGKEQHSLLGKTNYDLLPKHVADNINFNDKKILASGEGTQIIEVIKGQDGKDHSLLSFKFPIKDDAGKTNLCSISIDITERLRLEQEVREANEKLTTLIQASPLGIIVIQANGKIIEWNKAAEKVYGWTRAEALAGTTRVVPEDKKAESQELLRRLLSGEQFVEFETERLRKDGTRVPVTISATCLEDPVNESAIIVGMHADITERIRSKQAILEAKEVAEAATRAKSEFLANMSHEIRTPMNAVIGMTGLLLDTNLDKDQMEFASTIRSSSETLLALINDILDFSKIEAGQLDLEETPFDVQDCIEEALDLLGSKAAEKQLDIAYLIENNVPRSLAGDVTRLRQILVNLVSNAVKFTTKGDVLISLAAQPLKEDLYQLKFSVRDTGIGIPADRMDRLFRSFSQVDTSTTRHYGGTGLGLAISKRLCEMMGGTMWVESEKGKGSNFFFTIKARVLPNKPRVYHYNTESTLAGKSILIVDDNATNRRVLLLQTQGWGMIPSVAASGQEAIELLRLDQRFDVAILDLSMPEMDGYALAKEIRGLPNRSDMRLILLSSIGYFKGQQLQDAGFAAVLTKPVKASQLYNLIIQVLGAGPLEPVKPDIKSTLDRELGDRHPLRILLAEDNVVNQKVALRILDRIGYRADLASNGLEVIQALCRQPYDVILMDVQMPEMDGLEASRKIVAEWPANKRPRIIAMTANTMQGDQEKCFAAGMDGFVSKPVRIEELQSVLERSPKTVVEELPPASIPITASINTKVLDSLRGLEDEDNPNVVVELIEIFLEEAPLKIANIQEAIDKVDASNLNYYAHSLKGSSANLGATKMVKLCGELEHMGSDSNLNGCDITLVALKEEFELVKVALEKERLN